MSGELVTCQVAQAGGATDGSALSVLGEFLNELDASGIGYALIHHRRDDLSAAIHSDIDIAFDRNPQGIVPKIIEKISRGRDVQLVHCLHYEIPFGYYYMLRVGAVSPAYLHLDCLYDPVGINRYILPTSYFLGDAIREDGIRHASTESEAIYLLIKRAIKGGLTSDRLEDIKQRVSDAGPGLWARVDEIFGPEARDTVNALLQMSSTELAEPLLVELRKRAAARYRGRHPMLLMAGRLFSLARKIGRFFRPTGYFVVLLGPDGSGKSTVSDLLLSGMERAFRKTWRFHWRPGLLPKLGRGGAAVKSDGASDNTPASESKYRGIVSLARYIYYWLDFVVGYWLVIYPRKAQTTLVLGERYFPDVLVHPERYGFSIPRWFMRLTSLLVPAPDLVLLLADEPDVIYARKPELSVETIAHQIAEYRNEMRHWGDTAEILTQGGAENVALRMRELILQACAERAARMTNILEARDRWLAFPPTCNPKLWINGGDDLGNALRLYHPCSIQGKFVKRILASTPNWLMWLYPGKKPSLRERHDLARMTGLIRTKLSLPDAAVSYYLGTPGAHRKMTAQVSDCGMIVSYVKISDRPVIKEMLERERSMLDWLAKRHFTGALIPHVQDYIESEHGPMLFLSAPDLPSVDLELGVSGEEARFLGELARLHASTTPIDAYLDRVGAAALIARLRPIDPEGAALIARCIMAVNSLKSVFLCASHGDYAPWNALMLEGGNLYVFDWEYADTGRCALWDIFHRLFMPGMLVLKMDAAQLIDKLARIHKEPGISTVVEQQSIDETLVPKYLLLYLIEITGRLIQGKGLGAYMKASLDSALERAERLQ